MTTHASSVSGRRAAFLLPLSTVLWASQVGVDAEARGGQLFVVAAVCGLAGVLWQLLHRRDLVDRLTHFASAFVVIAVVLMGLPASSIVQFSIGFGVGLSAVLTGLVFTEQWFRSRVERRIRRQPTITAADTTSVH